MSFLTCVIIVNQSKQKSYVQRMLRLQNYLLSSTIRRKNLKSRCFGLKDSTSKPGSKTNIEYETYNCHVPPPILPKKKPSPSYNSNYIFQYQTQEGRNKQSQSSDTRPQKPHSTEASDTNAFNAHCPMPTVHDSDTHLQRSGTHLRLYE